MMSISNYLQLTNLELGLILLILGMIAVAIRARHQAVLSNRKKRTFKTEAPAIDLEDLKGWVNASETLCEALLREFQEKKKIVKSLMDQWDEKIGTLNQLLNKVAGEEPPVLQEGNRTHDLSPQILEMAESGCDAAKIARWLKLSEGEVQLTLDLRKYGSHTVPHLQEGAPRV